MSAPATDMLALVIGGSGGIGAALVQRLLETAHITRVVATWHTKPPPESESNVEPGSDHLVWMQLDASDPVSVWSVLRSSYLTIFQPARQVFQ